MAAPSEVLGTYHESYIGQYISYGIVAVCIFCGVVLARILPNIVLLELNENSPITLGDILEMSSAVVALIAISKHPFIPGFPHTLLTIYSDHLEWKRPEHQVSHFWSDIEEYVHDITMTDKKNAIENSASGSITLDFKDGKSLKFDTGYDNLIAIARHFAHLIPPALAPSLLEQIKNGYSLQFGQLTVSKDGLMKGKHTLSWDQVIELRKTNTQLSL